MDRIGNAIEKQIGPGGELSGPVRGLANKLPEHAARLAGVLAVVADINASEISAEQMAAGIALAQHYAAEALRLFEGSRISVELQLAQKLLDWLIGRNQPLIALRDMYLFGPNAIRDKQTAIKVVSILEDHGWLLREEGGAEIDGHHRRDVWRLIKGE